MKKMVFIVFAAGFLAVTGCSESMQSGSEQFPESVISENIFLESSISENEMSENHAFADETLEYNDEFEGISKDDIVNRSGVFGDFWTGYYNAPREITVGDYNEKFPVELQELLIDCNDDIEGDIDWGRYAADYEMITLEEAENRNLPYDEILAVAKEWGSYTDGSSLAAIDVDADGDDEYIASGSVGIGWQRQTLIIKYIESEWVVIGGQCGPEDTSGHYILDYDGRYYLLFGNVLSYWNDEVERPDLSYWKHDGVLGYDDCWNELEIQKTIISYTPYEIYTNAQDDTIDYLTGIDLETLKCNDAEDGAIEDYCWYFDDICLDIENSWRLSYGKEQYLYVIAHVSLGRNDKSENDRILMTLHQTEGNMWEIAKVYYLAANYDLQLMIRKSQ